MMTRFPASLLGTLLGFLALLQSAVSFQVFVSLRKGARLSSSSAPRRTHLLKRTYLQSPSPRALLPPAVSLLKGRSTADTAAVSSEYDETEYKDKGQLPTKQMYPDPTPEQKIFLVRYKKVNKVLWATMEKMTGYSRQDMLKWNEAYLKDQMYTYLATEEDQEPLEEWKEGDEITEEMLPRAKDTPNPSAYEKMLCVRYRQQTGTKWSTMERLTGFSRGKIRRWSDELEEGTLQDEIREQAPTEEIFYDFSPAAGGVEGAEGGYPQGYDQWGYSEGGVATAEDPYAYGAYGDPSLQQQQMWEQDQQAGMYGGVSPQYGGSGGGASFGDFTEDQIADLIASGEYGSEFDLEAAIVQFSQREVVTPGSQLESELIPSYGADVDTPVKKKKKKKKKKKQAKASKELAQLLKEREERGEGSTQPITFDQTALDAVKKDEAARKRAEEAERALKAKEEEERKRREEEEILRKEAERKRAEEEKRKRKAEEERRRKEEEERKRKEEEERKRKEEEERKRREEEERKRQEEEERKKREEEERKRKEEEERKRKEEEERKRKEEEERKKRAEEERKRKEEERRRAEEEARKKKEEEKRKKKEEERKRTEEEERKRKEEEEREERERQAAIEKASAEEAERLKQLARQRQLQRQEEAARRKAEEEARRKAEEEEETRRKAEGEAKRKAAEEARKKAEEEARRKAEEEARKKAEEEARKKAEEETKRKAEEEARKKAEEEARKKAAEEARKKAEEEARRKAEEEARKKAEEEAKKKAEEEARKKAEEEAKRKAEEEARKKAEEEEKLAAARKAREEAEREIAVAKERLAAEKAAAAAAAAAAEGEEEEDEDEEEEEDEDEEEEEEEEEEQAVKKPVVLFRDSSGTARRAPSKAELVALLSRLTPEQRKSLARAVELKRMKTRLYKSLENTPAGQEGPTGYYGSGNPIALVVLGVGLAVLFFKAFPDAWEQIPTIQIPQELTGETEDFGTLQ
uniref:Uncharacterized protein n=1 Tax=Chromera velia CCMP2878 TaxID=1169474 RepID=A0A0G4HFI2_9ALVE|eukprot:Cvel_26956.t1-p1 / transcript=Cvel_26956.t1 / gene=Cvel_26956 / organism=Chromera_velia_CCMP2878 / gene_product=hypothetical protein / transcript_product=hypothetical protein / location=Cvel_scaffold3285:13083-16022(+) / protein_length=980 / sequence_SO=supercontig / SO=protein_coding / is_pseudo=false